MWSHQSPSCSSAGSAGSQFSGFLPTKDHFSSNWTSRVSGGKSHELVVQLAGVVTGQPAVAHYRIAMHLHKPLGLADAAPLGQVLQDRDRLLGGDVEAVQGCPLAFREPRTAGAAPQEPVLFLVPVAAVDHEVLATADAVVRTRGVQAAEAREVVHDVGNSWVSAVKSANLGNLTC